MYKFQILNFFVNPNPFQAVWVTPLAGIVQFWIMSDITLGEGTSFVRILGLTVGREKTVKIWYWMFDQGLDKADSDSGGERGERRKL